MCLPLKQCCKYCIFKIDEDMKECEYRWMCPRCRQTTDAAWPVAGSSKDTPSERRRRVLQELLKLRFEMRQQRQEELNEPIGETWIDRYLSSYHECKKDIPCGVKDLLREIELQIGGMRLVPNPPWRDWCNLEVQRWKLVEHIEDYHNEHPEIEAMWHPRVPHKSRSHMLQWMWLENQEFEVTKLESGSSAACRRFREDVTTPRNE